MQPWLPGPLFAELSRFDASEMVEGHPADEEQAEEWAERMRQHVLDGVRAAGAVPLGEVVIRVLPALTIVGGRMLPVTAIQGGIAIGR